MASQRPKKWYAVGHTPVSEGLGVYASWAAARPFCIDPSTDKPYVGCRFKGFENVVEAAMFIEEELAKSELHEQKVRKAKLEEFKEGVTATVSPEGSPTAARGAGIKRGLMEILSGSSEKLGGAVEKRRKTDETVVNVYTDGSCVNNGKRGARAGFGVYFGPGDSRNLSKPLEGQLQTNQRAELSAIKSALEATQDVGGKVVVHSDSMYSMQCITEWSKNWQSNGWRTAKGQDVKNRDLIEPIDGMLKGHSGRVEFRWVKGHSADVGNQEADRLAKRGVTQNRQ